MEKVQDELTQHLQKTSEDLARYMKESNRKLEKFGLIQGEVAEDLFRRNVKELLSRENIRVDKVITNMKEDEIREYDIVAVNGNEAVVFGIKNKLRSQDLMRFTEVQLPQFKEGFPRYRDFAVYGGVGTLVVNKRVVEEARKRGLFVMTQGQTATPRFTARKSCAVIDSVDGDIPRGLAS